MAYGSLAAAFLHRWIHCHQRPRAPKQTARGNLGEKSQRHILNPILEHTFIESGVEETDVSDRGWFEMRGAEPRNSPALGFSIKPFQGEEICLYSWRETDTGSRTISDPWCCFIQLFLSFLPPLVVLSFTVY